MEIDYVRVQYFYAHVLSISQDKFFHLMFNVILKTNLTKSPKDKI